MSEGLSVIHRLVILIFIIDIANDDRPSIIIKGLHFVSLRNEII